MRFRPSAKRTSPFKSQSVVQSTTCSRCVRISGSNAGYTMLRSNLKSIRHPLHSPGSPSLPIPCVTVCHHISIGLCMQHPTYCSSDRHFARINQNKKKREGKYILSLPSLLTKKWKLKHQQWICYFRTTFFIANGEILHQKPLWGDTWSRVYQASPNCPLVRRIYPTEPPNLVLCVI